MARTLPACGRANDDDARFCQQLRRAARARTAAGHAAGARSAGPPPVAARGRPADARRPPGPPPAPAGRPPPRRRTPPAVPPRKGKPAPRWLVALVVVAVVALVARHGVRRSSRAAAAATTSSSRRRRPPARPSATSPSPGARPVPRRRRRPPRPTGWRRSRATAPSSRSRAFAGQQIWQIAYSPDGKWLACIAGTYKRSELWLFDTDDRRRPAGDGRHARRSSPSTASRGSRPASSSWPGYTETPKATGQNADLLVYDPSTGTFAPLADAGGVALRGVVGERVARRRQGRLRHLHGPEDRQVRHGDRARSGSSCSTAPRARSTELGTNKALFDVNARAFDEPLISPNGEAIIYRRAGSDVGTSYTVIGADGTDADAGQGDACSRPATPGTRTGTKVVFTGHSLKPATGSGIGRSSSGCSTPRPAATPTVHRPVQGHHRSRTSPGRRTARPSPGRSTTRSSTQTGTVYLHAGERRRLAAARPRRRSRPCGRRAPPSRCRRRRAPDARAGDAASCRTTARRLGLIQQYKVPRVELPPSLGLYTEARVIVPSKAVGNWRKAHPSRLGRRTRRADDEHHPPPSPAEIEAATGVNPATCYQCGKCSAGCPMASESDLRPHQVMRRVMYGPREQALRDESIWLCLTCETCSARCPNACDPARVIDAVREISHRGGRRRPCRAPSAPSTRRSSSRSAPTAACTRWAWSWTTSCAAATS